MQMRELTSGGEIEAVVGASTGEDCSALDLDPKVIFLNGNIDPLAALGDSPGLVTGA
jgi:hypothetical protein